MRDGWLLCGKRVWTFSVLCIFLSVFPLPRLFRSYSSEGRLFSTQDGGSGKVVLHEKAHKWGIPRVKKQFVKRKKQYVKGDKEKPSASKPVVLLSSVTLDALRPYIKKAEKNLGMEREHPSSGAKEFAEGFVGAMESVADGNLRKRNGGESQLPFFKPYLGHCDTAKSFVKLITLSCALGDFFASRSKEKLPKEAEKIARSWKSLSYHDKGSKIGRFISRYYTE